MTNAIDVAVVTSAWCYYLLHVDAGDFAANARERAGASAPFLFVQPTLTSTRQCKFVRWPSLAPIIPVGILPTTVLSTPFYPRGIANTLLFSKSYCNLLEIPRAIMSS